MKKPRCENCGRKVHPAKSAMQSFDTILSEIPSHCPNCGAEISDTKQKHVDKYTDYLSILKCIPVIGFIILIIILIIIF
ncbi:MAG: hypothetical protein HWN80_01570 [Candidatus Lokiarchaeota archaeon]|nr:hypothetical protein [Candidatus Lokiarchaeota archaeon]